MMKDGDIEIRISGDLAYEKLTFEIFYKDIFVAMLSQEEKDEIKIHIFPGQGEVCMPLDLFERSVKMAKMEMAK